MMSLLYVRMGRVANDGVKFSIGRVKIFLTGLRSAIS